MHALIYSCLDVCEASTYARRILLHDVVGTLERDLGIHFLKTDNTLKQTRWPARASNNKQNTNVQTGNRLYDGISIQRQLTAVWLGLGDPRSYSGQRRGVYLSSCQVDGCDDA